MCIYAYMLGEPRLSYSPHVVELTNLARVGSEGEDELKIINDDDLFGRNSGDWQLSVESPRPADPSIFEEEMSMTSTEIIELSLALFTSGEEEMHQSMMSIESFEHMWTT